MSYARTKALIVTAAACAALAAEAAGDTSGSVVIDSATRTDDNVATITGRAVFVPVTGPQSVVGPRARFRAGAVAATAAGEAAGLALTDAIIEPLANGSGLRFTWRVASMPEQVPPEGLRYTWTFMIGHQFRWPEERRHYVLQAKRTNLVSYSTIEEPMRHIQHAARQQGFFELRGCGLHGAQPCHHLTFLQGRFDIAAKTISLDLPFGTKDALGRVVAPDFNPGAALWSSGFTSRVITASLLGADEWPADTARNDTTRWIGGTEPYYTTRVVEMGVGHRLAHPVDLPPLEWKSATLDEEGRFIGNLTARSRDTVWVRACNGTHCAYTKHTFGEP